MVPVTGRVDAALRTRLRLQRRQGPITLHPPQLASDLRVRLLHLPQGELPGLVRLLQLEQVYLLFLGQQEIAALASMVDARWDALAAIAVPAPEAPTTEGEKKGKGQPAKMGVFQAQGLGRSYEGPSLWAKPGN